MPIPPRPRGGECYATGCETTIRRGLLMCRRHWSRVPRDLQAEVYGTWRAVLRGESGSMERWLEAAARAREALETVLLARIGRENLITEMPCSACGAMGPPGPGTCTSCGRTTTPIRRITP